METPPHVITLGGGYPLCWFVLLRIVESDTYYFEIDRLIYTQYILIFDFGETKHILTIHFDHVARIVCTICNENIYISFMFSSH